MYGLLRVVKRVVAGIYKVESGFVVVKVTCARVSEKEVPELQKSPQAATLTFHTLLNRESCLIAVVYYASKIPP